jgi:hypothetical protein
MALIAQETINSCIDSTKRRSSGETNAENTSGGGERVSKKSSVYHPKEEQSSFSFSFSFGN